MSPTPATLPEALAARDAAAATLRSAEHAVILAALRETGGRRVHAAQLLGMPLRTFHLRLAEIPNAPPAPPNLSPTQRARLSETA